MKPSKPYPITSISEVIRTAAAVQGWDRRRLKRELRKGGKSRYALTRPADPRELKP